MRAVIQRVAEARVEVDGHTIGTIDAGLLVYLGVGRGDTPDDMRFIADKVMHLRLYPDDQGRMKANAAWIRAQVFPYDDVELDMVQNALDLFVASESLQVYEVGGTRYLQFLNWWTWQKHTWAWPSKYPPPQDWQDRVCYRKGNTVVKSNWDDGGAKHESESESGDPTLNPSRPHSGASLGSAPSTSTSGSISTSISGSGSGKGNNMGADAAECLRAVLDLGITEPKASQLVRHRSQNGGLDTLVSDLRGWIAHHKSVDGVRNPIGLSIAQVESGIPPPLTATQRDLAELPY